MMPGERYTGGEEIRTVCMSHCEGDGYSNSTSSPIYSSLLYSSVTTTILPETKQIDLPTTATCFHLVLL